MFASANALLLITTPLLMIITGGNSEIVEGPVNTEVRVGDSTYLNCSISDPLAEISWFHYPFGRGTKYHNYVYINGQLQSPYNKRFRMESEVSNGSYNLVVPNAEQSDAGIYVCQNGGTETSVFAELIVIESDPVCVTNINSVGFIGPNSCGLNRDVVELSCAINYTGNINPTVHWTQLRNGISRPVPNSQSSCSDSGKRIVCNYTAYSDIEMDGSVFVCQTSKSRSAQYNCKTDVIKVHYAIGERMPTQRTVGDAMACSANTNALVCSYKWIWSDGNLEEIVSENEQLTITKAGWHRCQVNCYISQHQCSFNDMTVLANVPTESSSSSTVPVIIAFFVALGFCCIIGLVIAVVYLLRRQRNTRKELNRQKAAESTVLLDTDEAPNQASGQVRNNTDALIITIPVLQAINRMKMNEEQNIAYPLSDATLETIEAKDVTEREESLIDAESVKTIEEAVKKELPCISNCMLVGEDKKFLSLLLTIKVEKDPNTSEPLDKLSPEATEWIKAVGSKVTKFSEIADKNKTCKRFLRAIREGIDRVNSNATSPSHFIKRWAILPKDFSICGGELNATMEVDRLRVAQTYSQIIEEIYSGFKRGSLDEEKPNQAT